MSILNRLRSLLGVGDKEEKNDSKAKKDQAKESVKVTSSKKKLDDNIVSGTKTSEPISKVKSDSKDMPSEIPESDKDSDKKETSAKEEVTIPDLAEEDTEIAEEAADEVVEEEKDSDIVDSEEDDKEEVAVPDLAEEDTEIAEEAADEVAEEEKDSDIVDSEEDDKEEVAVPDLAEEDTEIAEEAADEVVEKESEADEECSNLNDDEEDVSEEEDEIDDENTDNDDKKRDIMTLLTDKELIKSESLDKDFTAEFIDAGIETVKNCFQCGTCGGTCPSGRRTPYKVRQLVRKCLLGLKEDVISDDALWMCTTCYTCQERCPRSVIIVGIVKKARNIAAHAGYMAKPHKMTGLFVIKTGHGVPINPATRELRQRVGLGELPPTTHKFPEALEEVQKICKITGFDELIGYDEATGELKE